MDIQTNVLRDGEWVTETVNLNSVLRGNTAASSDNTPRQHVARPDSYGILTRTVVDSSLANHILPVRLRSDRHRDVAFIGDHYVQICEMGSDNQLRDIIRKRDFGARIVNAKVIGLLPDEANRGGNDDDVDIKMEDDDTRYNGYAAHDVNMTDTHTTDPPPPASSSSRPSARLRLPRQQLLIILDNGDQIFMFLRLDASSKLEFVTTQYPPHRVAPDYPGYHAAVDPSSRYMALACEEGLFVVNELESPSNLSQSYESGNEVRYIKTRRPRSVQGAIHKMEFLFPRPDDDYQIILLLIIIQNGQSRMVVYEWEAGESLRDALRAEEYGQSLPASIQNPLLIVPLTFHSAFFAVAGEHIMVCSNALHRPAEFSNFVFDMTELPSFPYGDGGPSWSAWTRPYRLARYNVTKDSIYLARRDGAVVYLELDMDNLVTTVLYVGVLNKEIGPSLCSLYDQFSDILIAGSHSGPSTINKLLPRIPTDLLGTVPNWAPIADFVTTDEFATTRVSATDPTKQIGASGSEMTSWRDRPAGIYTAPDRMFAASGHGPTSAITEFRNGLRAYAGLDFDAEGNIRRTWIFPVRNTDFDPSFHILISFVDRSLALHLSSDLAQVSNLGGDDGDDDDDGDRGNTQLYDVDSRTVAAAQFSEDVVIQVTENNLVFAAASGSVFHAHSDTFGKPVTIVDAYISGALVAISTHTHSDVVNVHLLRLGTDGAVTIVKSFEQSGDSTCLHLSSFGYTPAIIAGIVRDGNKPLIAIYSINECDRTENTEVAPLIIDLSSDTMRHLLSYTSSTGDQVTTPIEALSSIAMLPRQGRATAAAIVFGTRAGQVGTILLNSSGRPTAANFDTVGLATVHLTVVNDTVLGKSVLATCDGRMCMQSNLDWHTAKFRSMEIVWVIVDSPDNTKPSPFITSTTVLQGGLPGREGTTPLVFSSGSRVMLAELYPQSGPAHRTMPLKGTPTKVIYSHHLSCLVVAISDTSSRATLQFIDPDTGADLSMPADRRGSPVDFVSGLGEDGDRILGLAEWNYEHDGNKWVFLLVSTLKGRFLVLSTRRSESRRGAENGTGAPAPAPARAGIEYWTRYRKTRSSSPVHAIVGEGNNVFSCVGQTLYWDKLDLDVKKLVPHSYLELPSVATSLRIVNGKLVALTNEDSVQIIEFSGGDAPAGHLAFHHADPKVGMAGQMIELYPEGTEPAPPAPPILIVSSSELESSGPTILSGLWVPWRLIGRDCSVVFEADLQPERLRKLVRCRTRPVWQRARRDVRYGMLASTADAAEIMGAFEDGSLQHYTLLGPSIWRIMRYIQNLALASEDLYPFTYEDPASINGSVPGDDQDSEALDMLEDLVIDNHSGMHIDGDMLKRCLDGQALEKLFGAPERAARLFGLMDDLDSGRWTAHLRQSPPADGPPADSQLEQKRVGYFSLLYDILEYYLAPVF